MSNLPYGPDEQDGSADFAAGFLRTPVEVVAPILDESGEIRTRDAVAPVGIAGVFWPARLRKAFPEIAES